MVIRYAGWTTCATPWFITHHTPTEAIRKYYSPPLLKSLSRLVSPIPARAAWDGWTPLAELVQVVQVRKQKPFNQPISSVICHLSSFIFYLLTFIYPSSFILHPSSFFFLLSSSAIRHLLSSVNLSPNFHPIHLFTYSLNCTHYYQHISI